MTEYTDLYEVLEINHNATKDEIKKAYRNMMKREHSDVNPENYDKEKVFRIQEAYQTLIDDEKKRQYDETGFTEPSSTEIDKRVANLVRTKFFMELEKGSDIFETDIISNMILSMEQELQKKIGQIENYKNKKQFLQNVHNRVKKKTQTSNYILDNIITQEYAIIDSSINTELSNISVIRKARNLVSEYEFDFIKRIVQGIKITK